MDDLFPEDLSSARARAKARAEQQRATHARLREHEADFTPRPVVRAILEWYLANVLRVAGLANGQRYLYLTGGSVATRPSSVLRILDACAGAGVWASEVRRLFMLLGVDVHITAIELREEEAPHLRRHADRVVIGDWRAFVESCKRDGTRFDLVVGNPPFALARAPEISRTECDVDASMPVMLADIASLVILYNSQQAWTKTSRGYEVRRRFPPAYAVDVPGSINHRSGVNPENDKRYAADKIPYSACLWLGAPAGPHVGLTPTGMIDPIDGRSWREDLRPGAEPDEWLAANGIPTVEGVVEHIAAA